VDTNGSEKTALPIFRKKVVTHHELGDCRLKSARLLHLQQLEDFAIMLLFFNLSTKAAVSKVTTHVMKVYGKWKWITSSSLSPFSLVLKHFEIVVRCHHWRYPSLLVQSSCYPFLYTRIHQVRLTIVCSSLVRSSLFFRSPGLRSCTFFTGLVPSSLTCQATGCAVWRYYCIINFLFRFYCPIIMFIVRCLYFSQGFPFSRH